MIIDAHQHFWDLERTPQPWMTAAHEAIARAFAPSDLLPLLAACGIAQTVLVQGACLDDDTDYLFELADRARLDRRRHGVGRTRRPRGVRRRLGELRRHPKLRGIRHLIHDEPDPHWIVQPRVLEGIALVEEAGLLLELPVVYPNHFGDVAELALRFPRLVLVDRPPRQAAARDAGDGRLGDRASRVCRASERRRQGLRPEHRDSPSRLERHRPPAPARGRRRLLRGRPADVGQRLAGLAPQRHLRRGTRRPASPPSSRSRPTTPRAY